MQAKGFFGSLFDFSFSSFITPKLIKVLYVLLTIGVALWTLILVFVAFHASSALGILTLLIIGPILFVIGMIYARVSLELLIVLFRIHGDIAEINVRGGGTGSPVSPLPADPSPAPAPSPSEPVPPAAEPASAARFCDNCGAERSEGKRFCPACGVAYA